MGMAGLFRRTKEVNKVLLLPLGQIEPNPYQPRTVFEEHDIRELADSISANGLLQPISVREVNGGYELIAGQRRLLAYRLLGEDFIPSIVVDYTDRESAIFALIENLQRKDLNYLEEAFGIARLMEENSLTQQEAARYLGKAQSTIANKLRLLKYSPNVQNALLHFNLTERHARALLLLNNEDMQLTAIGYISEKSLTVSQTEEYIAKLLAPKPKPRLSLIVLKDMRIFQNTIDKAISRMNQAGVDIVSDQLVTDNFIEYTIRIPKNQVYKQKSNIV